jgi:hypothetical protein
VAGLPSWRGARTAPPPVLAAAPPARTQPPPPPEEPRHERRPCRSDPPPQVTYAAGDEVLLTAGYDQTIRVWDCRSRSPDAVQIMKAFRVSPCMRRAPARRRCRHLQAAVAAGQAAGAHLCTPAPTPHSRALPPFPAASARLLPRQANLHAGCCPGRRAHQVLAPLAQPAALPAPSPPAAGQRHQPGSAWSADHRRQRGRHGAAL